MEEKRSIKEVHLVFENLEVAVLDKSMFEGLYIESIHKSYYINSFGMDEGVVKEDKSCSSFYITILKAGIEKMCNYLETDRTIKSRLTDTKDLSHIDLRFDDGSNEYIAMPWNWDGANSQYNNSFQKTEITDDSILISVSPMNIKGA